MLETYGYISVYLVLVSIVLLYAAHIDKLLITNHSRDDILIIIVSAICLFFMVKHTCNRMPSEIIDTIYIICLAFIFFVPAVPAIIGGTICAHIDLFTENKEIEQERQHGLS